MHIAWVGIAVLQSFFFKKRSYDKKSRSDHIYLPLPKGRYNDTHLKQPVLIRRLYLRLYAEKVERFALPRDSQTISFRPVVDSQISHGGRIFQDVVFAKKKQKKKHSPLFIFLSFQICFSHCVFSLWNTGHNRLSVSVSRHICMNFALSISPRDGAFNTWNKSVTYRTKNTF